MRLSVIIPAYNEQDTILAVIRRVRAAGVPDLEIIVVNDCSTDSTGEKLESLLPAPDLVVVHHPVNRGKGAAIRTGQSRVTGEAVIIQDADLEYSPEEYPRMLPFLESGRAEAVFGSRYSGRELLVDSFWHYAGNRLLTLWSNVFTNLNLSDMETCYKMIRADVFKDMELECNRFGIEPELTAKLARRKCRIYEVPISYVPRTYDQGKKIGWKDALAAFYFVFKYNVLR